MPLFAFKRSVVHPIDAKKEHAQIHVYMGVEFFFSLPSALAPSDRSVCGTNSPLMAVQYQNSPVSYQSSLNVDTVVNSVRALPCISPAFVGDIPLHQWNRSSSLARLQRRSRGMGLCPFQGVWRKLCACCSFAAP